MNRRAGIHDRTGCSVPGQSRNAMDKFCFSCGAPLGMPEFKGPAENYCKHCAPADDGKVMPRKAGQAGFAQWFLSWQPRIDQETALQRADACLKAMPYWVG